MKVIIGTSIVPTTTLLIFLFVELGILLTSFPQFVYAQTAENEIIENALKSVEKATTEGISKITESLNSTSNTTDSTNTSDRFILQNQSKFKDSTRNWINGESDKLSFRYPNNWDVNVSDSRFDNYELIFTDKASNSSIRVSDEALSPSKKILYVNHTERYFNTYMMQHSPLSTDFSKIDTYPKGKVSIAGLPAYSELYLDQANAILISLAFQEGNDRHYTVVSKSPSSNYDNLEPTMLEIIKSITPITIQKQSDQEVKILSNDTNSDDLSNKKGIEQVKKEDSLKKESLLLSNKTESNNTLNESLIIEQQQQKNGSLSQTSNIYEGLGIKIKYFDPWEIIVKEEDPSCPLICSTMLSTPDRDATILITQDKFDDPKIKDKCRCDTLLEFVKYIYEENISADKNLIFINDNQTTLTDDNIPAIQMEFETEGDARLQDTNIDVFIKGPNSFYGIVFSTDKNQQYSKYLIDFKKMINSLEFVSTNETKKKQPSFMISNGKENRTEPLEQQGTTDQQQLQQQISELTLYEDPNGRFTLEYDPSVWIAIPDKNRFDEIEVTFTHKTLGGSEAGLVVGYKKDPLPDLSSKEIAEIVLPNVIGDNRYEDKQIEEGVECKKMTIQGYDTCSYIYSQPKSYFDTYPRSYFLSVIAKIGDELWLAIFNAPGDKFDDIEQNAIQMINSIKITN